MKLKKLLSDIDSLCSLEHPLSPETDTLKYGNPEKEIKRVFVCMHADTSVLQEAAKAGADLVITHEPTFYCNPEIFDGSNHIAAAKMKILADNDIALYRYHDHPHAMHEDMIDCATVRASGLPGELTGKPWWAVTGFRLSRPMTAKEVALQLEKSLPAKHIRIAGTTDIPGRNIAFACGTPGHTTELLLSPDWDFIVTGEICEWAHGEMVKDAALQGRNKAVLVLGHGVSEEAGMRVFADLLQERFPELEVIFLPNLPLFSYTD